MKNSLHQILSGFVFSEEGKKSATVVNEVVIGGTTVPVFINEFWTSRQRQAHSLHEVSYRACFKPQLPHFFIERLTRHDDVVYDPFSGRGTTAIEAALLGRKVIANDVNPLSKVLAQPRLFVPSLKEIAERLKKIPVVATVRPDISLSMFYHPRTLNEILSLKRYLHVRSKRGKEDHIDRWIRMVATNRLTGHSKGFFSVYTLPPNQALSPESQKKINARRKQKPEYRDTKQIILKKSRQLLRDWHGDEIVAVKKSHRTSLFLTGDARSTKQISRKSIQLTVTSPPFLDVVQYAQDNWLRCWFNGIDAEAVARTITMSRTVDEWRRVMGEVFVELYRITKSGGWVAFEVGEVRGGKIALEEHVVQLGIDAGFHCAGIMINRQQFTKTANIWGVKNNAKGTNSNRIVLFRK